MTAGCESSGIGDIPTVSAPGFFDEATVAAQSTGIGLAYGDLNLGQVHFKETNSSFAKVGLKLGLLFTWPCDVCYNHRIAQRIDGAERVNGDPIWLSSLYPGLLISTYQGVDGRPA
jgi:hypothetical protein